jgi:hypothetical protein
MSAVNVNDRISLCNDTKNRFYEKFQHVLNQFPKYHMKILLWDFNEKVRMKGIFKPQNERLNKTGDDIGARVANYATWKNLSSVQCSHVTKFINTLELLIKKDTIRLIISRKIEDNSQKYSMSNLLEWLTVTLTITWWLQKLRKD